MDEQDVPLDTLTKIYIKMRSAIQEVQAEYDSKLGELQAQKALVATAMKDKLMALKAKSVKTEHGLVLLNTKTRYYPSDWEAFGDWIKKHEAIELLERRVAQGNMKQYLENNPGDLPPGLNSNTEFEISVRKA